MTVLTAFVMAGLKREARLRAYVPAIHDFFWATEESRRCPAQGRA
jgi:hypothetical protein